MDRQLSTLRFNTKLSKLKAKRKGVSQIACRETDERSPYTNRCIKKCKTVRKNNQRIQKVRDPITNRCRLPIEIRVDKRGRIENVNVDEGCEDGWEKSRKTGRCVKRCFNDEIRNITTGRCQKIKPNEEIRKRTLARRAKILQRIIDYDPLQRRYLNDLKLQELFLRQIGAFNLRKREEYLKLLREIAQGYYDNDLVRFRNNLIVNNLYLAPNIPIPLPVAQPNSEEVDDVLRRQNIAISAALDSLLDQPVAAPVRASKSKQIPLTEDDFFNAFDENYRFPDEELSTQDRIDTIMNNESLPPPVFGRESRAVTKGRRPDVGLETSLSLDPFLGARDLELTSDEINDIIQLSENAKQGKSFDNNSERTSEHSYNLDDF